MKKKRKTKTRRYEGGGIIDALSVAAPFGNFLAPGAGTAVGAGIQALSALMAKPSEYMPMRENTNPYGGYGYRANGGPLQDQQLSSDSIKVQGNPQVTDGNTRIVKGVPFKIDHDEVINFGSVFGDFALSPNLVNPNTGNTFAADAAKFAKAKGKAETFLKNNPGDSAAQTTNKYMDTFTQELVIGNQKVLIEHDLKNISKRQPNSSSKSKSADKIYEKKYGGTMRSYYNGGPTQTDTIPRYPTEFLQQPVPQTLNIEGIGPVSRVPDGYRAYSNPAPQSIGRQSNTQWDPLFNEKMSFYDKHGIDLVRGLGSDSRMVQDLKYTVGQRALDDVNTRSYPIHPDWQDPILDRTWKQQVNPDWSSVDPLNPPYPKQVKPGMPYVPPIPTATAGDIENATGTAPGGGGAGTARGGNGGGGNPRRSKAPFMIPNTQYSVGDFQSWLMNQFNAGKLGQDANPLPKFGVDNAWGPETEQAWKDYGSAFERIFQNPVTPLDPLKTKLPGVANTITANDPIQQTTDDKYGPVDNAGKQRGLSTLGDVLQGIELVSKGFGLGQGPDVERLPRMTTRQVDSTPLEQNARAAYNAAMQNSAGSYAFNAGNRQANYANYLSNLTDIGSRTQALNRDLARQTEQFNIGQTNLEMDLNDRNRAAHDAAMQNLFTSIGNTGRASNAQRANQEAERYLAAAYPDIYDFLIQEMMQRTNQARGKQS